VPVVVRKRNEMTQEVFVRKCKEKYGNDFDYSMISYSGLKNRIKVRCNKCGNVFEIRADHFLYEKAGGCCPQCRAKKLQKKFSLSKEEFVNRAKFIHNDDYDYSKTEYVNMHKPIIVTCKKHGDFLILPMEHLKGTRCPECSRELGIQSSLTDDERREIFIKKAKEIHFDKNYDYSLVKYVNAKTNVEIICPTHGSFFQKPTTHLQGHGCSMCKRSLGEEKVEKILKKNGVAFVKQYKIENESSFCKNKHLYVDFFLPDRNIFIEYNGQQHYRKMGYFGGKQKLEETQKRDAALREYCDKHKISLIEIPYWEYANIETLLKNRSNL
jgi:hypothetical protein